MHVDVSLKILLKEQFTQKNLSILSPSFLLHAEKVGSFAAHKTFLELDIWTALQHSPKQPKRMFLKRKQLNKMSPRS